MVKDVRRSDNAVTYLQESLKELEEFKDQVMKHRSKLFDTQLMSWKAYKLLFYDSVLQNIDNMENVLETTINSIITRSQMLKQKFVSTTAGAEESKCKWRRMKESKHKVTREKQELLNEASILFISDP